jgi:hypothetical protein
MHRQMSTAKTLGASEILVMMNKFGVTRGGLQATITIAEASGELPADSALNAARALLMILYEIES